jgi:hypothetical protein
MDPKADIDGLTDISVVCVVITYIITRVYTISWRAYTYFGSYIPTRKDNQYRQRPLF